MFELNRFVTLDKNLLNPIKCKWCSIIFLFFSFFIAFSSLLSLTLHSLVRSFVCALCECVCASTSPLHPFRSPECAFAVRREFEFVSAMRRIDLPFYRPVYISVKMLQRNPKERQWNNNKNEAKEEEKEKNQQMNERTNEREMKIVWFLVPFDYYYYYGCWMRDGRTEKALEMKMILPASVFGTVCARAHWTRCV